MRAHQERMLSWVEIVVTPFSYAADFIAHDFGYPRERITAYGYGPTMSLTGIRPPSISRYAAANVLFVGRDWERKGGPLVFDALQHLRKKIPHATLTIIGPEIAPVQSEGIRFVGFIDKTTEAGVQNSVSACEEASVFCMPTHCEPWGLVFSEAVAAGLPIVSFNDWSLPDIVEGGVAGRLVERRDAITLAEALEDVLLDPSTALRMGQAAMRRPTGVLSWPQCFDRMLTRIRPEAMVGTPVLRLRQWLRPRVLHRSLCRGRA